MDTSYEGIKQCYYRVSAKAFIRDSDGRFCLVKEHTGKWDIPGGGIDHGEEPHEALKREIMEEMGLTVTKISPQPLYTYLCESSGIADKKQPICVLIYETEVENLDFTPSDECTVFTFVTASEAQELDLYYPNQKVMKEIEELER